MENTNYTRLEEQEKQHKCCPRWWFQTKTPSAIDQLHDQIAHAQKISRALNAKATGLWQKYNKLREQARVMAVQEKDKDGARSKLIEARTVKAKRLQLLNMRTNIEHMILKLEETHTFVSVGQSMGQGVEMMESMVSESTLESIEEMMDKWKDALETSDQMGNELANPIQVLDIDEELELLMDTPEEQLLPDVPTHTPMNVRVSPKENKKQPVFM